MKKTKFYFAFVIITLAFLFIASQSNAQFGVIPGTAGRGLESGPLNQVINIGDVPINGPAGLNLVRAKLHVNSFFIPASTAINPVGAGEVFRTTGLDNVINSWRLFTGAANPGTEKGMIFNYGNNPIIADQTNFSLQASVRDITFHTLPIVSNTVGTERMRIVGVNRTFGILNYPVNAGNVGIGTANPVAILHLGLNAFPNTNGNASGYRTWMNIGTFMCGSPTGFDPATGTDNMYVGLWQLGPDHADAIINWGNNPIGNGFADRLRFVFTAAPGNGQASQQNGLETARMIAFANNISRMGIGGDPTINLYSTGSPDPQNTVEINSPAASNIPGQSGLRFTDLTSTSNIVGNPGNGVLSVNNIGDVILVPGVGTLNNANNGTSLDPFNPSIVQFGNNIGLTTAQLINDREIPMSNKNIVFTLPGSPNPLKNRIGFGTSTPQAEVEIYSVNGSLSGNTLPMVRNGGTKAAGWQFFAGGVGAKNWILHSTGPSNYQGAGKFVFHSDQDSTDVLTLVSPSLPHMPNPDSKVGIQTYNPGNTLEINSPAPNANTIGGSSGLMFTDLNASTTPLSLNPGPGVLSVDALGNVVYVPGGGTGTGIGTCSSPTTFAPGVHGAIDLQNVNNFYFLGNGFANINNTGMGYPCTYNVPAKLSVLQTGYTTNQFNSNKTVTAGHFLASSNFNVNYSFGVIGIARSTYGSNFGVYGESSPIGVASSSNTNWAGFFNGALYYGTAYSPSDSVIKKDMTPIHDALSIINNLKPFSFKYDTAFANNKGLYLPGSKQYGFTSQDIDTILPELVTPVVKPAEYDSLGNISKPEFTFNALNYTGLIPITIQAVKQLDSTISAPPVAPVLISPADEVVIDGKTTTFTWHSVSQGVVLYHAQIAEDNSFSNIVLDQSGITDTTFSSNFCDTIPTTYYWRINAKNNAGTGEWSQVFSFTDTTICLKTPPVGRDTIIRPKTAVAFYSTSDSSFKTNIAPVTNAMYKVLQLNGVYYDWLHTNPYYDFDSTRQIGFNAQDVQSVVPEVVHTDTNGFLTLDYGRLVPVLVEAIKEQQDTINNLKNIIASYESRFNSIEDMLSQCCTQTKSAQTDVNATIKISTDATMGKTTELYQNRPNPFNVKTTFAYTLGEGGNVELIIEDSYGRLITTLVNQKQIPGDYSIDWNAENISSGIYFYSLKVNGIILVKKAIKY